MVYTLLAVVVIAFGWQVRAKGRDWLWASDMTNGPSPRSWTTSGPGCRGARVFLATAPVRVRGVYSNINAEGLAILGDCRPDSVATIVRLGHDSPDVQATLTPGGLTMTAGGYAGGFVTSADLQRFDIGIEAGVPFSVDNPLGRFAAVPAGAALVITQTFARPMDASAHWFVFTRGRLERLAASSPATPTGPGPF